jgi:lipid A 3-O-deacylase
MKTFRLFSGLVLALLTMCAAAGAATPQTAEAETDLFYVGYGLSGIADTRQTHHCIIEWRSRPLWYGVAPYIIGSWRETGARYIGAGLAYTISLSPVWKLTASSGPGYFERNGDFDLGSKLEFASSLELAYRFTSGRRLALSVGHISNAGAGRTNPGSEYVSLGIQFPFRWRRG